MWTWYLSKKDIQDWIDFKEREFVDQKEKNPHLTSKSWLQMYIFTYQYDIFFASFPIELYDWILRLTERKSCFKGEEPMVWILELIQQLKSIENRISRAINF